jgi:predicted membrane protein
VYTYTLVAILILMLFLSMFFHGIGQWIISLLRWCFHCAYLHYDSLSMLVHYFRHVRFFCLDFLKGYDLLISQFLCGCLWTGRLLLFELKEQSEEADTDSFQCATHIS